MEVELLTRLSPQKEAAWKALLTQTGLTPDEDREVTCLVWQGSELVATGSRRDNLLKHIAVSPMHQGQDLTATVLTALKQDAFSRGFKHLFLYTKPQNRFMFSSLFFYPVAQTGQVLLMEDRKDGVGAFLDGQFSPLLNNNSAAPDFCMTIIEFSPQKNDNNDRRAKKPAGKKQQIRSVKLKQRKVHAAKTIQPEANIEAAEITDILHIVAPLPLPPDAPLRERSSELLSDTSAFLTEGKSGVIGSVVMNCNPFTKGHRYLIETAARECDHLYVFILSEDKSQFSSKDRLAMAQAGTKDLPNVSVIPTGPYLISSATFPTYFLKDREKAPQVQCELDIEIFLKHYVPRFGITRRYVGTEPLSPMTNAYNEALRAALPGGGVELRELPRLETAGEPISASRLRKALKEGDMETVRRLAPETTYSYIKTQGLV